MTIIGGWMIVVFSVLAEMSGVTGQYSKDCRADICFVMDESGSIGSNNWQLSTNFVSDFIDRTVFGEAGTKYGIVKFDDTAQLAIALNQYTDKSSLVTAVRTLSYESGGTRIDEGLRVAREECFQSVNGDRPAEYAPNILILMTDGQSDKNAAVQQANMARDNDIIIISIGIGGYDLNTLTEIAGSVAGERVFTFENFENLLNDTSIILGESCQAVRECEMGQLVQLTGDYPNIEKCPYLTDPYLVNNNMSIEFSCNIYYNESFTNSNARYKVTFLFDGQPDGAVPPQVISPPATSVVLPDQYLQGRLNKYISCQVQSYFSSSPTEISPPIRSRKYWAGIAPSKRLIHLFEGDDQPTDLYFFSSLPIPCDIKSRCIIQLDVFSDSDRVAMYQPKTDNFTEIRVCVFKLFGKDWKVNESLAYDVHAPLQLLAKRDPVDSIPTRVIMRASVNLAAGAFNKYHLPDIEIFIHDQTPGVCSARYDPWVRMFDRSAAYSAMQQGYFVYVRSQSARDFEVQVRHFSCNVGNQPGCSAACAVAVHEGKYVMAIDACNDEGQVNILTLTPNSLDPVNGVEDGQENYGMEIRATESRKEYMIITAGGARIIATVRGRGLNIQITVPSRDFGKTSGLCGSFDHNPTNDFIPKGETTPIDNRIFTELNRFIESWRINAEDSLFMKLPDESVDNVDERFCHCADNYNRSSRPIDGQACGLDALEDPLSDIINPQEHVRALIPRYILNNAKRRRKRGTNDVALRTDDVTDYTPTVYPYTYLNEPLPTWTAEAEAQARNACVSAIDSSPAMSSCAQVKQTEAYDDMIKTCIMDIQRTGTMEWVSDRRREFAQVCVQMIITQNVTDRNSDEFKMVTNRVMAISNVLCPDDCNGRGQCVSGTCVCQPEYIGPDCSIKATQVPVLKDYQNGNECDIKESECRVVRVKVQDVANTPSLTCRITVYKPDGKTLNFTYRGELETPTVVRCPLPAMKEVSPTLIVYNCTIVISNDGFTFSPPLPTRVLVWDSTCMDCVNNKCTQKPNTCVVDGKCYNDGEVIDDCLYCDPSKNTTAGSPKSGSPPVLASGTVFYKLNTEYLKLQLNVTNTTIKNVQYTLVDPGPGVNISLSGLLVWTLDSPTQTVTLRVASGNCSSPVYNEYSLSLNILYCKDLCGENSECLHSAELRPGSGEYKCHCRESTFKTCVNNPCPGEASCQNLTCGYKCIYPSGTWSSWSSFTACSKPCDYGQRIRTRECLSPPCSGESEQTAVCNAFSCPVSEDDELKEQGVTFEFHQTSPAQVAPKRNLLHHFIASALNTYCASHVDSCCVAVSLRAKSNPVGADRFATDDDVKDGTGYPKTVKGDNVWWKVYVEVNTAALVDICYVPTVKRRKRATLSENRIVNPSLLQTVLSDKVDELSNLVQNDVTLVNPAEDTFYTTIVIPVAVVGTLLLVAIFVTVVVVLNKSTRRYKKRRPRSPMRPPSVDRGVVMPVNYPNYYGYPAGITYPTVNSYLGLTQSFPSTPRRVTTSSYAAAPSYVSYANANQI